MTPDELQNELMRASLRFIRDNDLSQETMKKVYHAFWSVDERLSELVSKKLGAKKG